MLFNSFTFVVFLALVLTAHWWLSGRQARNLLLLAASYVFYAWWDYRFLVLIAVSSAVDYACGCALGQSRYTGRRKLILATSLMVNLGVLIAFKYFDFFIHSTTDMLHLLGLHPDWPTLTVILPVGISFYTFQTLSYTIDVYRRKIAPCSDVVSFFLFVAFFPQLVAGPIEKARRLIPQLTADRAFDMQQAAAGLRYVLLGFLLKVVIADNLSPIVDRVYADPHSFSSASLLFATYCFAFQIYGDFAGYSFIAIGVAAMFGIELSMNFRMPYLSQSVGEFWRRWHISLSSWFSEYVYVALLGGNRVAPARRVMNVLAVFLASGLWHGANWTFVVWGAVNGVMYFIRRPFKGDSGGIRAFVNALICFNMICCAWIFFRSQSVSEGFAILARLLSMSAGTGLSVASLVSCATGIVGVLCWEQMQAKVPSVIDITRFSRRSRAGIYGAALAVLFFCGSFDRTPFIYFQF